MNKPIFVEMLVLRILKPLIHLLMRLDVSHSEFSEIAKTAYVDVAREKFTLPKRKMTTSRIAVLTGLSRKEVVRLEQKKTHEYRSPTAKVNRAARVVTGWLQDKDFCEQGGGVKDLPQKGECSFATLVERYSGDITAGAIRDELLNAGIVTWIKDDMLCLVQTAYIPDQDEVDQLNVLTQCAHHLLATGVYNITKDDAQIARYQRQLTHRQVNKAIASRFAQYCNTQSQDLLVRLDHWLNQELTNTSSQAEQEICLVGLGIYYFEEKDYEE